MLCPRHCALPEPPSASGRTWICSGGWTDFRLVPSEDVSKGATGASRTACESIRPCDVVPYDPARLFAYTVGDRFDATPATRWSYLITPTNEGCLVRQEFEHPSRRTQRPALARRGTRRCRGDHRRPSREDQRGHGPHPRADANRARRLRRAGSAASPPMAVYRSQPVALINVPSAATALPSRMRAG